jgi:glutathione synthase/RimK-type ligase-like ATP-grasp enzyme
MRIAYVSCVELPEADIDEKPLVDGLNRAGHDAVVAAWDDPDVDWAGFDVAVVRATWNYVHELDAFGAWIDRVDGLTTLMNPAGTMKWNLHKGYLKDLEAGGVPVVPTAFFGVGESVDVVAMAQDRGWKRIVIKPTVGAGSYGTRAFDVDGGEGESAQSFFDSMIDGHEMMVQEFMDSVETVGETSLVVIDGQLTHAIEKRPRFDDQEESVLLRETISDEMRAIVDRVISASGKEYLFARVDVMPGNDGLLLLSELEMLEPSLFFPFCSDAVGVMVRGIEKRNASVHS